MYHLPNGQGVLGICAPQPTSPMFCECHGKRSPRQEWQLKVEYMGLFPKKFALFTNLHRLNIVRQIQRIDRRQIVHISLCICIHIYIHTYNIHTQAFILLLPELFSLPFLCHPRFDVPESLLLRIYIVGESTAPLSYICIQYFI